MIGGAGMAARQGLRQGGFIGGDWGNTNLRLYLFAGQPGGGCRLAAVRQGPGVAQLDGGCEATLFGLVDDWLAAGALPIILAGAVGSNVGWRQAPYLDCPAPLASIAGGGVQLTARGRAITLLPGLRAVNPAGQPNVMRGEELQALGWLELQNAGGGPAEGEQLLVAPGTHCKWMLVKDGMMETFVSSLTGEVFALLEKHSLLFAGFPAADDGAAPAARGNGESAAGGNRAPTAGGSKQAEVSAGFEQGLEAIGRLGAASLLQALFTVRSRQLAGELSPAEARGYLSGLLVGADLEGAGRILGERLGRAKEVSVIAEAGQGLAYQRALARAGKRARLVDPAAVAAAGFSKIHQLMQGGT